MSDPNQIEKAAETMNKVGNSLITLVWGGGCLIVLLVIVWAAIRSMF